MIRCVAQTLAASGHAVIQATTGTGKSFGYQIPAIVLGASRDKRVIISTKTANLQTQIADKDLKTLSGIFAELGIDATSAVIMGRERYVCPLRLTEKTQQGSLLDEDNNQEVMREIADAWHGGQWDGLRDTLKFKVPQTIWLKVNNNRHVCLNDRCPDAPSCPHMAVKAQMKKARIIITNHSYLLSTIAAFSGGDSAQKHPVVDFENNYYLLDEAHHLHDECLGAFSHNAPIEEDIFNEAGRIFSALGSINVSALKIRVGAMVGIGAALRSNIKTMLGGETRHRFVLGEVPGVFARLVDEYANSLKEICDLIKEGIDAAKKQTKRASQVVLAANANAVLGQLNERLEALQRFLAKDNAPRAKWIEIFNDVCTVHAAPFVAATLAADMLWKHTRGVVLCSATIAPLGEFAATLAALGMPKTTRTLALSSPLDYSRARMFVPKFMVPANSPGYPMMVATMVRKLVFAGEHIGSLVYFTSRSKMETTYESLSQDERQLVIKQGDMAPAAMIAEHKRRVDAGRKSVIFGLDSISEGVDLPGQYCTLVVADKLPFPSMEDPILAAHVEYLEAKGMHAFPHLMLPMAGTKLAQVSGRLIRTESDGGDFWVLDRRIIEKSYGAKLMRSTPFAEVIQSHG
ncbi:helicase C-terminal domain-containing protein [Noviherbaspirillum pedocola]|uniref:Helicase ATP-binding domain-containing protein n=1 Tax=Noviherbaspirillum pedocola TaxID=2801341 RepID=A0A934SUI1_9BURK|nr:helicase C-terminal domain-containing protein [Noviherbaspirillum pedocola]MBK4735952.1 hypothetical protein [Noviherbaspirillum pedocola]